MDLASLSAVPTITLGGKEYRPSRIRPRDIGYLEAWFKEVTPDPRVLARQVMAGLPDTVAVHIWDQAREEAKDWPPTLQTPVGRALMMSSDGLDRVVFVSLRQSIGGFTLDQAREITEQMTIDDVARFFTMIFPEPKPEDGSDPKTEGPGNAPTGPA